MNICFVTDPLVTTMGAVRPALLLAREFLKSGYNVTLITPRFDGKIKEALQVKSVHLKDVGPRFSFIPSLPTLDAWARCLIRHNVTTEVRNSEVIINTSSCIIGRANVYYAQGLMTRALDDMLRGMPSHYKCAYQLSKTSLKALERRLVKRVRGLSKLFIANSEFCASMYKEWNIKVDEIINPPLDCSFFKPATSKPAADYVLTHFGVYGKEGNFSIIKAIADAGVIIKMFGNFSSVPRPLIKHSNIDFLGKVSDEELVNLYSNALYTLFAFNHEPFGYIPVESMACGTPVLTYDKQGPSETVINGKTGWLANTDMELFNLAVNIWKKGYDTHMRSNCRGKASMFDVKEISKEWIKVLNVRTQLKSTPKDLEKCQFIEAGHAHEV
jgi:glycosyltransferase involved in cell wall biosynthesis